MHVVRLKLFNWGPFRGEHVVELEPTVYAVFGIHDDEPERSNWLGKTWFLSAMKFALTGDKPESCEVVDDWITHDEPEGLVELTLSDGTMIERARKRGGSTRVRFKAPGKKASTQKVAQSDIYQRIGLEKEELFTVFVEQKQIHRLIEADPAVLAKIVATWLKLEPLRDAAGGWISDLIKKTSDERFAISDRLAADAVERPDPEVKAALEKQLEAAESALATGREALAAHDKSEQLDSSVDRLDELNATGAKLSKSVANIEALQKMFEAAQAQRDAANAEYTNARREFDSAQVLSEGMWDGECPMTCEQCPVKDEIRISEERVMQLEILADKAQERLSDATEARDACRAEVDELRAVQGRLDALRDEAYALADLIDELEEQGVQSLEDRENLAVKVNRLAEIVVSNRSELKDIARREEAADRDDAARVQSAAKLAKLDAELKSLRQALEVVRGAETEISEKAMATIEHGANVLLAQTGIDLSVKVRWGRAGGQLADVCSDCGAAFPKSARVKKCERCESPRGAKIIEKLNLIPSDRSGAADDIAGLTVQLAAASWLRAKRGTVLSLISVDEPFASLDASNKRLLASKIHALIRGQYAFDQGFLVAHDAGIMDALPARVIVRRTSTGSTLEVR